jgi:class 3 adenylate cyclase
VIFRRKPFDDVIRRQLDLFVTDHAEVLADVAERFRLWNAAGREEAEELYGDYVDAFETGTELLADARDHFAVTLSDADVDVYRQAFDRAVGKRLPEFALELENR